MEIDNVRGDDMIRSFEVRAYKKGLVCDLARDLDKELVKLQKEGWNIISIYNVPCEEYESCVGYFDSVLFVIIAEHE